LEKIELKQISSKNRPKKMGRAVEKSTVTIAQFEQELLQYKVDAIISAQEKAS
jgi:hypothetical protein